MFGMSAIPQAPGMPSPAMQGYAPPMGYQQQPMMGQQMGQHFQHQMQQPQMQQPMGYQ